MTDQLKTDTSPRAASPRAALRAVGLSRRFGGVQAVDNVTLPFTAGHFTGVIGPNGAGKSTVLAMLAGSLRPTSGRVLLGDDDITDLQVHQRAARGLLRTFQKTSEFPTLTVVENLLVGAEAMRGSDSLTAALFGRRAWRVRQAAAINEAIGLLARFGLERYADSPAGRLSGGQRRLVEILRAVMARPLVLLLDEPMAGVHPSLVHELGDCLMGLRADGMTIVMVEHELAEVDRLCDSVVVMSEGRVLARGSMRELRDNPEVVEAYLVG